MTNPITLNTGTDSSSFLRNKQEPEEEHVTFLSRNEVTAIASTLNLWIKGLETRIEGLPRQLDTEKCEIFLLNKVPATFLPVQTKEALYKIYNLFLCLIGQDNPQKKSDPNPDMMSVRAKDHERTIYFTFFWRNSTKERTGRTTAKDVCAKIMRKQKSTLSPEERKGLQYNFKAIENAEKIEKTGEEP